jgi:hypothetical protein
MSMGKVRLERYQRLRDLAKRIVDDPHSVDGDTKAKLKTATLKYASTQYIDTERALKNLYQEESELGSLLRKAVEIVGGADGTTTGTAKRGGKSFNDVLRGDGDDERITKADRAGGHHSLASAVVEHALDRLDHLRQKHGFEKSATKDHIMNRTEELRAIAKDYGVHRLCKLLVDEGESHGIDEGELVELISNHDRRDGETAAKCFARQYEANTDDGLVLRKAIQIAKAAAFQVFYGPSMQPAQIGGEDVNPDNVNEALRKLAEIGAKRWPHERPDVQFSRAFESEPALARQAHVRPA